jgi:hypothetical protein
MMFGKGLTATLMMLRTARTLEMSKSSTSTETSPDEDEDEDDEHARLISFLKDCS